MCVAALTTAAAAAVAGWLGAWQGWDAGATAALALAFGVFAGLLAWLGSRRAPLRLRWDGRQWHLGASTEPADRDVAGRLRLMIDLGTWLMVAFDGSTPAAGRVWLPLQRRGLEREWHALRCAVYATPAAAPAAAAGDRSDVGVGRPIE